MKRILLGLLIRLNFLFPDKLFLQIRYYLEMGKHLDLKNPQTMNEKLQWLKLYNRKPEYTTMVDKILVKEYVANIIGEEYIVPLIGVWNSPEEIDFDSLPNQFVLKTNHSGGNTGVIIVKDKSKIDRKAIKEKLQSSMKSDIYATYREWPYKNVVRKVFAEAYLGDDLADYKFYCYNGYADAVMICVDRQVGDPKFYFFDKEWNLKRYNQRGKDAPIDFTLPKPEGVDKMFELASILSNDIPYARVDFYNINGKIYFGEITFFPASGFDKNRLPESDLLFGKMIKCNLI
ncbi:MAG: glycosyl transferase [Bacteroidales bacterium]|nr:glycosyl transferase [Bacteroidales bacterium]